MKDPLLDYLAATHREYFGLDHIIGITSFAEEIKDVGPPPINAPKVGKMILNYVLEQKKTQRARLGKCYRVTLDRIKVGWMRAHGTDLLKGKNPEELEIIEALAGSRWGTMPVAWKKVPNHLKKRGVPGVLAYLKVAQVVEKAADWDKIDPGAPLQLWGSGFGWGHSPILYRYVTDTNGRKVAMVLADQWISFILMRRSNFMVSMYGAKYL